MVTDLLWSLACCRPDLMTDDTEDPITP